MPGFDSDWINTVARLNFEKRYAQSLEIIRAQVAAGNHAARVHLAMLHREAGLTVEQAGQIIGEVEASMDPSDWETHWVLSRAYDMRLGVVPGEEMDRRCFAHLLAAARLNEDPMDAFAVASFYMNGSLTTAIDLSEAERWLEEAISRGHPDAARTLRTLRRSRKNSPHK